MKQFCKHEQSSGFTLVELLVVIAVVAIIAAILFPVFARVREKARQITCLSNLRQLTLAFAEYTDDNDGVLPGAIDVGNGGAGVSGGWMFLDATADTKFNPAAGSLYPYVKNAQVYVCPDDGDGQQSGDSYAVNSCTIERNPSGSTDTQQPHPGRSLALFDNPSTFLLLGEEGDPSLPGVSTDDAILWYPVNLLSGRHSGGSNISFVDGHIKWYTPASVDANNFETGGAGGPSCAYP